MTPLYKPQFAYGAPEGFHDEEFEVPVSFTFSGNGQLNRGLPWQLDDDMPMRIRGIYFRDLGPSQFAASPGYCRIWDTMGNPLSSDLVLALGMWGSGGIDSGDNRYAWGFPIEPEIECAPGGILQFDFKLQTSANIGSGALEDGIQSPVTIYNGRIGVTTVKSITLVDPGAPNIALSVGVIGTAVTVTLATDGAGVITSTFVEVANAINASPLTAGVITAFPEAANDSAFDPAALAVAQGPVAIPSGDASQETTIVGTIIGVKRLRDC